MIQETEIGRAFECAEVEVSNVPSVRNGDRAEKTANGIVTSEADGLRERKMKKEDCGRMKITNVEKSGNAGVICGRIDPREGVNVGVGEIEHDCKLHLCGQGEPWGRKHSELRLLDELDRLDIYTQSEEIEHDEHGADLPILIDLTSHLLASLSSVLLGMNQLALSYRNTNRIHIRPKIPFPSAIRPNSSDSIPPGLSLETSSSVKCQQLS